MNSMALNTFYKISSSDCFCNRKTIIPLTILFTISVLQCSENKCIANALDKSSHDYELELLKKEKEEALAEEVRTTKAGK